MGHDANQCCIHWLRPAELSYLFIEVVAQCFDVSGSFDPESDLAFSLWDVCIICILWVWVLILQQVWPVA